jgi:hypothetical protein
MKKTKTARPKKPTTTAVHATHEDGEHHVVGIGNLRVLLIPDDSAWFAQGLEIDYAVQGETIEDAKEQFEVGLEATIQEHLRVYGNIDALLQLAPAEAWKMLYEPGVRPQRYSQVTEHHVIRENTFFEGIDYLLAATAAA